jgi:tetraacyldisaccharide 4'-kinase
MIFFRKILFPFAVLYGWITRFRNFLYDSRILKSYAFHLPVVVVGNLSVGGTGKTPQIEYLIRLLSDKYKIATLSRGYKRQSKGFFLADEKATPANIGDEPYQYYKKFPNIQVAVDADRRNGIEQLLKQNEKPEVILLDDAFQHRKVKARFYILLTAYGDLFCDDYMLPTGNLRESRSGAKRADMIIVTKCPRTISEGAQEEIKRKIGGSKPLFFTSIAYDDCVYSSEATIKVSEIKEVNKLLLAGIAKPKPFFDYLQHKSDVVLILAIRHQREAGYH